MLKNVDKFEIKKKKDTTSSQNLKNIPQLWIKVGSNLGTRRLNTGEGREMEWNLTT